MSILPKAQYILVRALDGEQISAMQLRAAREVIDQALGPAKYRFGRNDKADKDRDHEVVLWSGRDRAEHQ